MERGELIYLDNAATSYPKPVEVSEAVRRFMTRCGGNPGRGAHKRSLEAAKIVYECREQMASLFEAKSAEQVCFTLNTTCAINTCIKGLLKSGDHVLISDMEHNAVYRPVCRLQNEGVEYDVFPSMTAEPNRSPTRICAGIARRIKKNTKMVVCTGASNICSMTMPIAEIGAFCHRHGLLFAVDGAQSAGHSRISMEKMNIDALCVPAHKGLLGPQGCGAVIFGEGVNAEPLVEGGSGVMSLEEKMPDTGPERYEAGTLPVPAIAGLCEGLKAVRKLGERSIEEHERALFRRAREKLSNMERVKIYAPQYEGGVLLFNIDGYGSEETARRLSEEGICVRGGYHCSALGHRTLGTLESGGVRASFGVFNSSAHIDALCDAVYKISKE